MHFYAFLTRCIYAYCSACWFRCILSQLLFNTFACLTMLDAFRRHDAFWFLKRIHSNTFYAFWCIRYSAHSDAFVCIPFCATSVPLLRHFCPTVRITTYSDAFVCILMHLHADAFGRIRLHFYAFTYATKIHCSLRYLLSSTRGSPSSWQCGWCPWPWCPCPRDPSLTCITNRMQTYMYCNAHECIIVRMHQNATHSHASKCANMHHVQNAYIR